MISRKRGDNHITADGGFSLVELIICIAILAIATVPLLSAFSSSGHIIGKAQSYQNATSVAEGMMEEIKGSTIEQIKANTAYGSIVDATDSVNYAAFVAATCKADLASGKVPEGKEGVLIQQGGDKSFYVFYKPNVSATNGEKYDVIASIDATSNYNAAADPDTPGTVKDLDDASDANSIELPVIDKINKERHSVIAKEINRLDSSAFLSYIDNKKDALTRANKGADVGADSVDLIKEVTININENAHKDVDIECVVSYYDDSDSHKYDVREKVYSATFLDSPDTRIYIFYRTARQAITTGNVGKTALEATPLDKINKEIVRINDCTINNRDKQRQIYFILQEDSDHPTGDTKYYTLNNGNTKMEIYVKTYDKLNPALTDTPKGHVDIKTNDPLGFYGAVDVDRTDESKGVKLITNMNKSGNAGNFYYNSKNDYIYDVQVYVYDGNKEKKAELRSTKEAR